MTNTLKAVVVFALSTIVPSLEALNSACTPAYIKEKIRPLSTQNLVRAAAENGVKGNGVRRLWMNRMQAHGVKQATFGVQFAWSNGIRNLEVVEDHYLEQYGEYSTEMVDKGRIRLIRESGLESELKTLALELVARKLPDIVQAEGGLERAEGVVDQTLLDDECLGLYEGNYEFRDPDETDLMRAAKVGDDLERFVGLLAKDYVDGQDQRGWTALMHACAGSHTAMVQKLLVVGADVNLANKQGQTALMMAAWTGNSEVVKLLVEKGANVNARDSHSRTALLEAARVRFGDSAALRVLISAGADVNAADSEGRTPLMKASDVGNLESVQLLVAAGANINAKDHYGASGWSNATWGKSPSHARIVEMLQKPTLNRPD